MAREQVVVAEFDGAAAGFLAGRDGWINHLYVAPDHWRKGVGRALLADAMRAGAELRLWTFQRNAAARAFYRAFAFEELEFTDGAGNEEKEPDVLLRWRAKEIQGHSPWPERRESL